MDPHHVLKHCQATIECAPLALAATEGERHRYCCINPAFVRLTGTAADQLLGRTFADAFPDSRDDGSLALLDRVWRTGKADRVEEVEVHRRGGAAGFWTYTAWPMLDDEHRPAALIIQIDDTTERRRIRRAEAVKSGEMREVSEHLLLAGMREQELAEHATQQTAELNALLESMSDGVVVIDADARIKLINDPGRRILHLRSGEEEEWPIERLGVGIERLDGTSVPLDRSPIQRALGGERFKEEEVVLVHPDGSRRRVAFSGSQVRDRAGRVVLAIVTFHDVTDLRETEAMKEQMLSLISHDLRTPLGAILGYADLLSIQYARNGAEEIDAIVRNAKTMDVMIQDLVESARMESATPELDKQPCDLHGLVSEVVRKLVSPEKRTRIEVVRSEPLPKVEADPDRLKRVISNILTNALKFSPPHEQVTIRIERRDAEEVVSVIDRGAGVPAEDLPHLFERFYRSKDGTTAKADGLGLGLYISRLIVEAHGGEIWVESEPRKGTTVAFSLPIG